MLVYRTPADSSGQRWRVEFIDKIRIHRLTVRGTAGPGRVLRDLVDLDRWLTERGWDRSDLEHS